MVGVNIVLTPAELDTLCHILVQFDMKQLKVHEAYHAGCCYTKFRQAYDHIVATTPGFTKENPIKVVKTADGTLKPVD